MTENRLLNTRLKAITIIIIMLCAHATNAASADAGEVRFDIYIVDNPQNVQISVYDKNGREFEVQKNEDYYYTLRLTSSDLSDFITYVNLEVEKVPSFSVLRKLPLRVVNPVQARREKIVLYTENPKLKNKSLDGLAAPDVSKFRKYFHSKWLYEKAIQYDNYNLAVGAAYKWFSSSFFLARSPKTSDFVDFDQDSADALTAIIAKMDSTQFDSAAWTRAWESYFGYSGNLIERVEKEISTAKKTDWNMYRYVQEYAGSGHYDEACDAFAYFVRKLERKSGEYKRTVAEMFFSGGDRMKKDLQRDKKYLESTTEKECPVLND